MKMKRKSFLVIVIIIIIVLCAGGILYFIPQLRKNAQSKKYSDFKLAGINESRQSKMLDNWEYDAKKSNKDATSSKKSVQSIISSTNSGAQTMDSAVSAPSTQDYSASDSYIGYSVGGAQNIKNFRENIKNGYLPITTDITYNGIYSEYYFDTGDVNRASNEMFYPSYSLATSTNPLTGEKEYYMSVGLNSNIKESDFQRPKVNLVIALDISGSMGSSFDSYYYDKNEKSNSEHKTKMKIAEECVNNLIDKLNPDDRIGIVLFDNQSYVGTKISTIFDTDKEKLKGHILEIEPCGGTNFSSGYDMATEFFEEYLNTEDYQNRIVVITDAMPNMGETTSDGLYKKITDNVKDKIYTSFIGVGVDFNTQLTEKMSNIRGANYYSVHSSEEFNSILAENFDYMITPLIYDLDLSFKSTCYEIENVYGSDSVDKGTGNIMHINTLFPSASNSSGEVKGGIVVLKLKKIQENGEDIELKVSYKDVQEKEHSNQQKVIFKNEKDDYYDNKGIRKAIVLARYVNLMKYWIAYERTNDDGFGTYAHEYTYSDDYVRSALGVNERVSKKLTISENYKKQFKEMKSYIENEMKELNDNDLENEIDILNKLI
ncbi:MAG: VWA domain-containing protein [Clostridia bacterium]|nr:VWA domain-containing protein [Clostridia bacterium]